MKKQTTSERLANLAEGYDRLLKRSQNYEREGDFERADWMCGMRAGIRYALAHMGYGINTHQNGLDEYSIILKQG